MTTLPTNIALLIDGYPDIDTIKLVVEEVQPSVVLVQQAFALDPSTVDATVVLYTTFEEALFVGRAQAVCIILPPDDGIPSHSPAMVTLARKHGINVFSVRRTVDEDGDVDFKLKLYPAYDER